MRNEKQEILSQAKRWVEQEKTWDDALYATGSAEKRVGVSEQKVSPARPLADPPTHSSSKAAALKALYEKYKGCTRCQLGRSRIKFVFGVGNPDSEILFIGEGPGFEEDHRGEPFVGKSGQLLDKMMAAIGLSRQTNAFIANIVKCHPMVNPQTPEARGNDRPPTPDEVATCAPILLQQIAIIQPRMIMTLGSPSTKMVLHTKDAITGLRGKMVPFDVDYFYPEIATMPELNIDANTRETMRKIRVIPTYHPAALLRNPNLKPEAWEDLKLLRDTLAKRP